jgi:hypothetical protein
MRSLISFCLSSVLVAALLVAACGPRENPTRPAVPVTMSPADDFENAVRGGLGREWYTVTPAYAVELGQVSTRDNLKSTTLAVWRAEAPPDQFAEVKVGDLAGGTFDEFKGLEVFVRLATLGGSERVSLTYSSDTERYEIRHEGKTPRVLASTPKMPPPSLGDVVRLEAHGSVYAGRLNGQVLVEATGPLLEGRHAGFAVGIDMFTIGVPRRVIDAWASGGVE